MSIEISSESATCFRCGKKYSKRKGNFPVSYSLMHRGVGYIPICKSCIELMYNQYLSECGNAKDAVRQMCRKLDLYWNESVFTSISLKGAPRSLMGIYLTRITSSTYAGKCYDDTLATEEALWDFSTKMNKETSPEPVSSDKPNNEDSESDTQSDEVISEYIKELSDFEVTKDIIAFWGTGYTKQMYAELEQRRAYWMSRLPADAELDIGTEPLIRQICSLELDINRDRADGKAVDKSVNVLNTLLGSANLKPTQRDKAADNSDDKTPFGVWIRRFENEKPVPEPDPEFKDVDGIKKYILVWVYGHLMKMLGEGKENSYSRLYEEEIEKLRVDKPEYADEEDDEEFLYDTFSDKDEEDTDNDEDGDAFE